MTISRRTLLLGGGAVVAGCSAQPSRFRTYDGPDVTSVLLLKERRTMHLLHENRPLKSYHFALGFAPQGHKQREGDGRTPEGPYRIDRRNPNSAYHLSLGISYPNARDRQAAQALGMRPGGDIFIHGTPQRFVGTPDWTAGCIAVLNPEIEEIYAMVHDGTPIFLQA